MARRHKVSPKVVQSLLEVGDRLVTFCRFQRSQWKSLWMTKAVQQLQGEFRRQVRAESAVIELRRAERLKTLAAREAALMEARRRCRLLERLKERRRAEWRAEEGKELEALASESFLARWSGRKARASR